MAIMALITTALTRAPVFGARFAGGFKGPRNGGREHAARDRWTDRSRYAMVR
jgi:hypothetical protein